MSFTNTSGTALVKLPTGTHVPVSTLDCGTGGCHSTSVFTTGGFATSALTGATMSVAGHTAALGVNGSNCAPCHGSGGSIYTGVKIIDSAHISSSYYPAEDCGVCHTASTTNNYASGGFTGMTGSGLPTHTNILTNCAPCHNNVIAKGTASFAGHMAIGTTDCSSCHTPSNTSSYTTFLGASGAGHGAAGSAQATADAGNCAAVCHKSGGPGKIFTSQHIPSSTPGATIGKSGIGQCDYCHTTSYASMSFTAYASANIHNSGTSITPGTKCSTCHNGTYTAEGNIGAQAKTLVNHIPTTITDSTGLDCTACHYYPSGAGIVISATAFSGNKSVGEYMNHNGDKGGAPYYCVTCHLKGVTYLSCRAIGKPQWCFNL